MKKFLAIGLLLSANCFADTIATSPNQSGGMFVLTDVKCTNEAGLVAYTTKPNSNTGFGCWFVDDNFVHINWKAVGLRSYELSGWTMVNKPKRYD
jgi:hypothetical protein